MKEQIQKYIQELKERKLYIETELKPYVEGGHKLLTIQIDTTLYELTNTIERLESILQVEENKDEKLKQDLRDFLSANSSDTVRKLIDKKFGY